MKQDAIHISQIIGETTLKPNSDDFAVCWIKNEVNGIEIDGIRYENVSNSIFFLDPKFQWKIFKKERTASSGYILYLAKEVLNVPE